MAWRPDKCIVRGEIDNTVKGRVTGRIWLLGREEPLILDLNGDAWPDVAGSRLTFLNPSPEPQPEYEGLRLNQTGSVGDITASQKVKKLLAPEEEWKKALREERFHEIPWVWANALYLEWYSDFNGRVVIQTTECEITTSERLWVLDPDEHAAQQAINEADMVTYLENLEKALNEELRENEEEPQDEP
ncbi:hypothetical protein [Prosthecobacter sp.]|uniref:hypothetical protein n=1 Tax=Prosthecobacter sp. TaxID=1965333 RepID=UPI00378389A7